MEFEKIDRSDEVRSTRDPGPGAIEVTLPASAIGPMLCWATHPLAEALGLIAPGVPCCASCARYPVADPT